jgi:hypothetical protein
MPDGYSLIAMRFPPMRRLVVLPFVLLVPSVQADETADLLARIKRAGPRAENAADVRAAWDQLVRQGPSALPAILEAMDTPDTVAANWLRTAFDRIADKSLRDGGKGIDADALLRFVMDTKRQGRARRLALDVVERLRPGSRDSLLRGALHDPEFRADAVDRALEKLAALDLPKDQRVGRLKELFTATRDLPQSRAVAARLRDAGETVSVADHFGFLRDWYFVGPFDANGMKGFKSVYPPEQKIDLAAAYEGKDRKPLRWKRFTAKETTTGNHVALVDLRQPLGDAEDAVGYAYTTFEAAEARDAELRGAADDNMTIWLNGERVFGFEEYCNGVRFDRHRVKVRLKAGVNVLLVKVCQAPLDRTNPEPNWEFLLRICDSTGKGLTFKNALPSAP